MSSHATTSTENTTCIGAKAVSRRGFAAGPLAFASLLHRRPASNRGRCVLTATSVTGGQQPCGKGARPRAEIAVWILRPHPPRRWHSDTTPGRLRVWSQTRCVACAVVVCGSADSCQPQNKQAAWRKRTRERKEKKNHQGREESVGKQERVTAKQAPNKSLG